VGIGLGTQCIIEGLDGTSLVNMDTSTDVINTTSPMDVISAINTFVFRYEYFPAAFHQTKTIQIKKILLVAWLHIEGNAAHAQEHA
jgi:hypothetical protein